MKIQYPDPSFQTLIGRPVTHLSTRISVTTRGPWREKKPLPGATSTTIPAKTKNNLEHLEGQNEVFRRSHTKVYTFMRARELTEEITSLFTTDGEESTELGTN